MEMLRSGPDAQGVIVTSIYKSDSDKAVMLILDCASNVQAGSPSITAVTYLTIATCRWVDASNFCVQLPSPPFSLIGCIVEIYAEGGPVTIFPPIGVSTFLDGSSSFTTTTGAKFRCVLSSSFGGWAKLD